MRWYWSDERAEWEGLIGGESFPDNRWKWWAASEGATLGRSVIKKAERKRSFDDGIAASGRGSGEVQSSSAAVGEGCVLGMGVGWHGGRFE